MNRLDFLKSAGAFLTSALLNPFPKRSFSKMKQLTADAVIVGGSYAGLSAAMVLGRSLRRVVIIDSGLPCNRQTPHSHNLITQDGATPSQITASAKAQVLAYPTVSLQNGAVVSVTGSANSFTVHTAAGQTIQAKKVLFATGVRDLLPAIPGFAECWGISVIHCPYCHGYEYRDQPTGILVNGPTAVDFGKLIRNWTKELTVFTNGEPQFSAEQQQQLAALSIGLETRKIEAIVHKRGVIQHLLFTDGSQHSLNALYARVPFEQHCPVPQALYCTMTETGHVSIDAFQRTSVPGVYAAGDNSALLRSVANSIGAGNIAGNIMNHDLINEEV